MSIVYLCFCFKRLSLSILNRFSVIFVYWVELDNLDIILNFFRLSVRMQTYGTVMFGWTLTILALWWFQHLRSKPGLSWLTSSWKMFHMLHFISAYFFLANMIFSIFRMCTTILDYILVYISLIFLPLVLLLVIYVSIVL